MFATSLIESLPLIIKQLAGIAWLNIGNKL